MDFMMDTTIIGISGGSGSGKSVFIRDLISRFKTREVTLLSQDNYYKPRNDQLTDSRGIRNFDLPFSIDLEAFTRDIRDLSMGQTIRRMEYGFNNPLARPDQITIHPASIILVEGLFLFSHPPIWEMLDLKVFIQASDSQRLKRRIVRDQTERNYPLEDVLYRYEHHVFPAYKSYIEPYLHQVDIVINNFDNYQKGLNVLEAYIRQLLN